MEEEYKISPASKIQLSREEEKQIHPEVQKVLDMFEEAGYITAKASNSYVLAHIIADYANKAIKERNHSLALLNYWETDDIEVVTRLAFERFRIYNTRTVGDLHESPADFSLVDYDEEISGGVRYNPSFIMKAEKHWVGLGNINDLQQPVNLKILYSDLLAGGGLAISNKENRQKFNYVESFMDTGGAYIEKHYYILPDENGYAILYPTELLLSEIKKSKFKNTTLKLLLFKRRTDNLEPMLSRTKESIEITVEYLRFITTELFAKFAILNRMSLTSFLKFVKLKYDADVVIKGNQIFHNVGDYTAEEIENYANYNVIPPGKDLWESTKVSKVWIIIGSDSEDRHTEELKNRISQIIEKIRAKIDRIATVEEFEDQVFYVIGEHYSELYGMKAFQQRRLDQIEFSIVKDDPEYEDEYFSFDILTQVDYDFIQAGGFGCECGNPDHEHSSHDHSHHHAIKVL